MVRRCRLSRPRLGELETRVAPAGLNALVSRAEPSLASEAGGGSLYTDEVVYAQTVSSDGRFVAFVSEGTNLVAGQIDDNISTDVFLRDRQTGTTTLVSRAAGSIATAGNGLSHRATMSADGRYVAFESRATDLVAGAVYPPTADQFRTHIFVYDRVSGLTSLVSRRHDAALAAGSAGASRPLIAADGSVVLFRSAAVDLVANFVAPPSVSERTFAYERATGEVTLIDHRFGQPTTADPGGSSFWAVSADGRYVSLTSDSATLLASPPASGVQLYRYDRQSGEAQLMSRSVSAPTGGNAFSRAARISDDGRWLTFYSKATNLSNPAKGLLRL